MRKRQTVEILQIKASSSARGTLLSFKSLSWAGLVAVLFTKVEGRVHNARVCAHAYGAPSVSTLIFHEAFINVQAYLQIPWEI